MDESEKSREWVLNINRKWFRFDTFRKVLLACLLYICIVAVLIWVNYSKVAFDRRTWTAIILCVVVLPSVLMCVYIPSADRANRIFMVVLLYDGLMFLPFKKKAFEFNSDSPLLIGRSDSGRHWLISESKDRKNKIKLPIKAFPGLINFVRNVQSEIGREKIMINEGSYDTNTYRHD